MFCASGFQFQNFLASLSAHTRQVIQNVLTQRPSSNASALANAESRLHASAERQNDVLKDMDLQELLALARKVDDVELNRFLTSPLPSHYADVHTSSESFFINKHGFSQSQVSAASFSPLQSAVSSLSHGQLTLLTRRLPQSLHMVQRGFKTLRSDKPRRIGFGSSRADSEEEKLSIFRSIRDSLTGSRNRKSEKLTQLVMFEKSPEAQEKLKVAFAEGYMANSRRFIDSMQVWGSWFRRILIWSIIIWIGLQVIQNYGIMGGNMKINVLKGEKYEVDPEDIKVSFSDVKGVDEAKEELQDIVEFLKDPDKFRQLGAKLPKGVLLVGPPGIGKTLLARAVAGEAGVPFFQASGSEFDEIFVGTGAKRVRQLFAAAKEKAPCVVFIDEIDTVGAKRTSSQIHPYANQTINQLLSEMDGFLQSEGVIVLGATNRRDNLDKALLRPGRFDVEVRVHLPDLKGRKEIFELYLSKIKYDRTSVDIEQLARGTTGCTGADLENIVNQAALKAAIDGERAVTMAHMEFARDKVFMGPARKSKIMDEETNRNTASHEAGHTIVAYYTKDATPLHKVTIVPRGMSLGHTSQVSDKEMYQQTKSQLLAMMDVAMGGRVAEEMTNGPDKVTTGASDDFKQATAVATAMVKRFGMSDKVGVRVFAEEEVDSGMSFLKVNELSPNTQELIDSEIKRLLQESYDRAKGILRSHQAEHRALTQALLSVETLDANDVKAIMEGRKVSS